VREECVVLEDVADRALLRRPVHAPGFVEPGLVSQSDDAALGSSQPGDGAQNRRLAGAGRPDERDGLRADVEREL
jgi:hypothetical protein